MICEYARLRGLYPEKLGSVLLQDKKTLKQKRKNLYYVLDGETICAEKLIRKNGEEYLTFVRIPKETWNQKTFSLVEY